MRLPALSAAQPPRLYGWRVLLAGRNRCTLMFACGRHALLVARSTLFRCQAPAFLKSPGCPLLPLRYFCFLHPLFPLPALVLLDASVCPLAWHWFGVLRDCALFSCHPDALRERAGVSRKISASPLSPLPIPVCLVSWRRLQRRWSVLGALALFGSSIVRGVCCFSEFSLSPPHTGLYPPGTPSPPVDLTPTFPPPPSPP